MKHSLEHQLRKYLMFTMLLTILFVSGIMLLSIGGSAVNLLQSNQMAVVRGLQSLYEKTSLPVEELLETYPLINHSAVVLPRQALDDLPSATREQLRDGQIVYSPLYSTSMVRIGGQYLLISAYPLRNRLLQTLVWVTLTLFGFFVAGMFLATLGSRRFSRNIVRLSRATRTVAAGDFSVQVREDANAPLEVQMLTHNFNLMVRELGRNATLKNDFISAVSHEFKTPLAAIRGYATYASDPSLTDEQRADCLRVVLEEADALTSMTSNILKLSKLENQEIPEKHVEFQLDEQLRQCVLALEPGWSAKNLELDIDLQEIRYVGDDELLRQVWINLLQNAIKFSEDGGTLGLKLAAAPDGIHVAVSDTGIGMSEEVARRAFDKFYQGDRARHAQGNGLGLSLVQQILKLVGGHIELVTAPGQGSTFTVVLPREPRRSAPEAKRAPEAIPVRTGAGK